MPTKRKAISKKKRFDIFKRDLFTCQYCGITPPKAVLQVDHIIPVKSGGDNNEDNLITSCQPCNLGKSANSLEAIPKSLSEKAKETKEREDQVKGYNKILIEARDRLHAEAWEVANLFLSERGKKTDTINRRMFSSIKMFVEKMGKIECLEAMDIALDQCFSSDNTTFKYFCGVMWNRVRLSEMGEQ